MTVDILLSTYNSEIYLEDLMKSLMLQSYTNWSFLIRDDCSTDNTLTILNSYKKSDPEKFHIIENEGINLGPKKSFEKLLENSNADYILFCDHDDYWLSHKIEDSIKKIKEIENNKPNKAVLVCTDLSITDENLHIIHNSFCKYSKIKPTNIYNTYRLAINNPVVGCTVIINKIAKSLVLPFSEKAIMHDWWMALKVSESGIIEYINKPSILYRQHNKNEIGSEKVNLYYFLRRTLHLSKTIKKNRDAFKMLQSLEKNYSFLKFIGTKLTILFSKVL